MPVPMHMVTMPYLPPVRFNPCSSVAVRMALLYLLAGGTRDRIV